METGYGTSSGGELLELLKLSRQCVYIKSFRRWDWIILNQLKVWTLCKDGKFTVKSWNTLIDTQVWKSMAPQKLQTFIWLAIQQKLCTTSFLCCHPILSLDQTFCPFCNTVIETSNNMLIHYQFAWTLWTNSFHDRGLFDVFHTHTWWAPESMANDD